MRNLIPAWLQKVRDVVSPVVKPTIGIVMISGTFVAAYQTYGLLGVLILTTTLYSAVAVHKKLRERHQLTGDEID